MRVLITNLFVKKYSGSENVVQLLAEGLRRAGHQPVIYAPVIGEQAEKMRRRGIQVVDRAAQLTELPDVIHAQHLTPCLTAMARFPEVPVVFACHSSFFNVEAPMPHPQIREVIAVDDSCAAKCREVGVPADRLSVILNAVDLDRFKRRPALPAAPRKALLLTKNRGHRDAIRAACARAGLALDELGPATGRFVPEIETVLGDYDLVFATARMALEAAATGCAVVVCDDRGFAGMLTSCNLPAWRPMNFGVGILTHAVTAESVGQAIAQYDATDATLVTDELRRLAGADDYIRKHLEVYRRAIARPAPGREAISLATANWVEELAVTTAERKWKAIAKELGVYQRMPERVEVAGMADEFADLRAKLAEVSARPVQADAKPAARPGRDWQLARRLKQAIIPKSLRRRYSI